MKTKHILLLSIIFFFCFKLNAQTYLLGPQGFDTDIITHGTSGSTTAWWAPSYYTPIDYSASGGNPGGYAGYSGNESDWWGNFLRMPQVNCTGYDSVLLSFDMSNSSYANPGGDWIRFYLWDNGGTGQYRHDISSIKIDGVESLVNFGANGFGFRFNVVRTWARVEVKFYLTNVINKTNLLFYIELIRDYYNSNTYFVKFDNIGITTVPTPQAATIVSESGNRSRCVGDSVSFRVNASGTPTLNYQWKKDGVAIAGANSAIFIINPVTIDTAGNYYCVVSNGLGSDSTAIMVLSVHTSPTVSTNPTDTSLCAGGTATFHITANSTLTPTYQWMYNGGDILGANSSSLVLTNVIPDTSGYYRCRVTNTCGVDYSLEALLTVYPLPSVWLGNDTTICAGSSITLDAGLGFSAYTWYNGMSSPSLTLDTSNAGLGVEIVTVWVADGNNCINSDVININFTICSAVSESEAELFSVSPIPANDQLVIISTGGEVISEITLFDLTGRKIERWKNDQHLKRIILNTVNLLDDSYLICIQTSSSQSVQKILISH
jgi:hypothetical protein